MMFEKLLSKLQGEKPVIEFGKEVYEQKDLDFLAQLIKDNKIGMTAFQKAYDELAVDNPTDNLFQQNADNVIKTRNALSHVTNDVEQMIDNIVDELMSLSYVWDSDTHGLLRTTNPVKHYSLEDVNNMPENMRPQLTGHYTQVDIPKATTPALLDMIKKYQQTGEPYCYHKFRQGMDILDIDSGLYQLLDLDPNSMSKWLPQIQLASEATGFFKIPKTKILRVPITLLQTTRVFEYEALTPLTIEIINRYIRKVFELDIRKDYFIKTGTFSSKFEFRNAKVTRGQEVCELGSYLWYIQHQASQMASSLNNKVMYGVSSNNEWVVREYIDDVEDNPTIYNGLPLHTEYRVFVDFDTNEIIGVSPYWEPTVMKENFMNIGSSSPAQKQHDYIVYSAHEHTLMQRYHDNVNKVTGEVEKLLPHCELKGQWSLDIMQNGSDFYIIDMALAANSALSECVPAEKLKPAELPFSKLQIEG